MLRLLCFICPFACSSHFPTDAMTTNQVLFLQHRFALLLLLVRDTRRLCTRLPKSKADSNKIILLLPEECFTTCHRGIPFGREATDHF